MLRKITHSSATSARLMTRTVQLLRHDAYNCQLTSARRVQRMLLIPGTGNGEPWTGVWELVYSGNLLENSKWRTTRRFQTQILPLVRVEDKLLFKYCLGEAMKPSIPRSVFQINVSTMVFSICFDDSLSLSFLKSAYFGRVYLCRCSPKQGGGNCLDQQKWGRKRNRQPSYSNYYM